MFTMSPARRLISAGLPAPSMTTQSWVLQTRRLSERYRVSRSVIRDAVKILAGKGLLEVRRGIGTRVKSRQNWLLFDDDVLAWSQAAPVDPRMLHKLMEFRQIMEPNAAAWAGPARPRDRS